MQHHTDANNLSKKSLKTLTLPKNLTAKKGYFLDYRGFVALQYRLIG